MPGVSFNFGKTSEGRFEGMRSASGNGFDSSDSFAVSGAAERTARLHDTPPSITPSHGDDSHLLSRIASPADVKALAPNELAELCREIRTTLLAYGHQHGGHIGSNLGMVEATVACTAYSIRRVTASCSMYPTKATCIKCSRAAPPPIWTRTVSAR